MKSSSLHTKELRMAKLAGGFNRRIIIARSLSKNGIESEVEQDDENY
jgi:ABC-type Mn2+/Zn2+ transport system ATPase subunit